MEILQFFAHHNLIRDGAKQHQDFIKHIESMEGVIEKEKDKKQMTELNKLSITLFKDMLTRKQQRNF